MQRSVCVQPLPTQQSRQVPRKLQNNQGLFSFRSTKNTFLSKAVGAKADKLNGDAALHNLQVTDTVAFDLQTAKAARDWSIEPGKETRCKLLATIARAATGVPELDNGETLWQCNWVQISEPSEGHNIKRTMELDSDSHWRCGMTLDQSCSLSQSRQL